MYGSPLLSTLTSPKKGSCADQQAADHPSVDDLLDNPWHYDCVVSPRLLASDLTPSPAKSPTSHPNSLPRRSAPSPAQTSRPRLSPSFSLLRQRSAPPSSRKPADGCPQLQFPPSSPPSGDSPSVTKSAAAPKPADLERSLTAPTTSSYVSLASFIQNADKSSYGSSAAEAGLGFLSKRSFGKPIKPGLSKCREKGAKAHIRVDPSRIRSGSGCLAVD